MQPPAPLDRSQLLSEIERYYDRVPRAAARTEEVGPFTLFVRSDERGWPYYARPRLGFAGPFTRADVRRVRERQRALGAPEALEWVHEVTPALTEVVRATDLEVGEHPLMVLDHPAAAATAATPDDLRVEVLTPDHPELGAVLAAISAAFGETDEIGEPRSTDGLGERLASGAFRVVGAFGPAGAVGGGSHSPRGPVTELTGIAVLPGVRSRGVGTAITAALVRDAESAGVATVFLSAGTERVANLYAGVGFVPVGTACVASSNRGVS